MRCPKCNVICSEIISNKFKIYYCQNPQCDDYDNEVDREEVENKQ